MKKIKQDKKLVVSLERLRELATTQLKEVAGGQGGSGLTCRASGITCP